VVPGVEANPYATLLEELFYLVKEYPLSDIRSFETDAQIMDNDLVVMMSKRGNCEHSGIAVKHNGANLIESKVGEGSVVVGAIANMSSVYPYDIVRVYRRKKTRGGRSGTLTPQQPEGLPVTQ
jgi:hypothetical protein